MPNGNLLKQNRPKGVINVVNLREASESGICQKPDMASSLLNTLAPFNWATRAVVQNEYLPFSTSLPPCCNTSTDLIIKTAHALNTYMHNRYVHIQ